MKPKHIPSTRLVFFPWLQGDDRTTLGRLTRMLAGIHFHR